MSNVTIRCPACGFSRQIPCDKIPDGPRRVTCPKCQENFIYTKPAEDSSTEVPIPAEANSMSQPDQATVATAEISPIDSNGPHFQPDPAEMTDIGELFQESWTLYKSRFALLISLCLLGVAGFIAPILLAGGLASLTTTGGMIFVSLVAFGVLGGILCGIWCFGGLLSAVVDESLNLNGALRRGAGIILPFAWVSFLSAFIVCGGYLLLIIPGIIFSVWFVFAQFLLVKDDVRGMSALLKSKEYVRGQWFNVAIRLLLIWAVSGMIGAIPLAGPFLSLAFFPYTMIFQYLIFRDLQQIKGDVPYSCSIGNKLVWPTVSLLGLIAVSALVVYLVGFSSFGSLADLASLSKGRILQGVRAQQNISPHDHPLGSVSSATPGENGSSETGPAATNDTIGTSTSDEISPESISFFIYAVNYSGEVRVNGTIIQKLEGEPDMQYNYNLDGKSFRYGKNRVEVTFAEISNPLSNMLEVHMRISRDTPGGQKLVLGEWHINDKGNGSRTFDFEIPK